MRRYFIPQTLIENLKPLLENNGYEKLAKRHLIKCYYLIDKLYVEHTTTKINNSHRYHNLHSDILRELLGTRNTKEILTALESLKIIEVNKSYSSGNHSMSYRLAKEYLKDIKVILDDSTFTRKIIRTKNELINKYMTTDTQYHQLLINIKDTRLNYSKVNIILNEIKGIYISSSISNLISPMSCNLDINEKETNLEYLTNLINLVTDEKCKSLIFQVISLLQMEYDPEHNDGLFFIIDNKGNRCHNNISNLSKQLRQCIYQRNNIDRVYSNHDIKCSQILTLLMYLKDTYKSYFYAYKDFDLLEQYYNNDFYLTCMNNFGYTKSRDEFKEYFFKEFYYSKPKDSKFSIWFKFIFPKVYEVILELKSTHYSNFPIQMQRVESSFIFSTLKKIISKSEYRDLYYLTIHDSILVEQKDSKMIYTELNNRIEKRYGISNSINIEKLDRFKITKGISKELIDLNNKLKEQTISSSISNLISPMSCNLEQENKEEIETYNNPHLESLWVDSPNPMDIFKQAEKYKWVVSQK